MVGTRLITGPPDTCPRQLPEPRPDAGPFNASHRNGVFVYNWRILLGGAASAAILTVGVAAPAFAAPRAGTPVPLNGISQTVGGSNTGALCAMPAMPMSAEVSAAAGAIGESCDSTQTGANSQSFLSAPKVGGQQSSGQQSNGQQSSGQQSNGPVQGLSSPSGASGASSTSGASSAMSGLNSVSGSIPSLGNTASVVPNLSNGTGSVTGGNSGTGAASNLVPGGSGTSGLGSVTGTVGNLTGGGAASGGSAGSGSAGDSSAGGPATGSLP
jgi:hypothetical protein